MLLPARPPRHDHPRVLEHPQVLHHPETSHLELRLELAQGAPVALEKAVEQVPARRVCEGLEDAIVVGHGSDFT